MIQTIRVISLNEEDDTKGLSIKTELNGEVSNVRTSRLYRVEGIDRKKATVLANKLLHERINQAVSINGPIIKNGAGRVEIAYKPGVMNPEAESIIKAAKDLGIKLKAADSSWEYYFSGKLSKDKINIIVNKLSLLNKTVEYIVEKQPQTLLIKGEVGPTKIIPLRNMNNEELILLSKDKLFLNLPEMKIIQDYFGKIRRDPTDCELETLAQTWSEHCAHKTFKAKIIVDGKVKEPLIRRIKKEALKHKKNIVSAFVDNSGVMDFYDGTSICGKVETHNSPSAIEPYGGAMTGSGGVFRDVLGTGLGAKTIVSTDIFCFARPDLPLKKLPLGCLPPDYLLKRVVYGVRDYGNRMGIPTNNGSVHFHDDFRAKPTIIVGAYGIIPKKLAQKGKPKVGDLVIAVGGRTGRDGIHGNTFASAEMTERTIDVHSSAVQIGNAIEEKRMFDAIIEARDEDLIRAIQDCGAGGFSSAIGEMGERIGVRVDLSLAPLKYQGLSPWEIWVSESQERMILAIPKNKLNKFTKICQKYNTEMAKLGVFDGSKKLRIYYRKELVAHLDMNFLHNGLPQRIMKAKKPVGKINKEKILKTPKTQRDWINTLEKVLSHGNVCSKEPIVRLYDHTVQGTNALTSFTGEFMDGPSDAAVMRPILKKPYGMIISHGLNSVLNNIDPYNGSIWAAVEALSNYVAVGGDYRQASLINNYIWPFPDDESLWSLDKSVDGVVEIMRRFKIPVISGKDSLSSTYRGPKGEVIKIPPVLCMSVFGKISDVAKTVSSDFKKENSVIYLAGKLDTNAMGGSIYYDTNGLIGSRVPPSDLNLLPRLFTSIYNSIQKNKILSVHDISEGGIVVSLFEMCAGGNLGADIKIPQKEKTDNFLFNETAGCFLIELENDKIAKSVFKNIPNIKLGSTKRVGLVSVEQGGKKIFEADIKRLKKVWKKPMEKLFS